MITIRSVDGHEVWLYPEQMNWNEGFCIGEDKNLRDALAQAEEFMKMNQLQVQDELASTPRPILEVLMDAVEDLMDKNKSADLTDSERLTPEEFDLLMQTINCRDEKKKLKPKKCYCCGVIEDHTKAGIGWEMLRAYKTNMQPPDLTLITNAPPEKVWEACDKVCDENKNWEEILHEWGYVAVVADGYPSERIMDPPKKKTEGLI